MKIYISKIVLTISLLSLLSTTSSAHTEKVLCRIAEDRCLTNGAFIPGTNEYNPKLSMGLFLVITNIEVVKSFEYVGKKKYINPENITWGVAGCDLVGNSRQKALDEARKLGAELKKAGICDYILEEKSTNVINWWD